MKDQTSAGASQTSSAEDSLNATPPRRSFFYRFATLVIGGVVGLFPFLAGLGMLFDPLRRRKAAADDSKWTTVTSLESLRQDGLPQRFPLIRDETDAWTLHENKRVGSVYLRLIGKDKVQAFTTVCPHAGCAIDYKPDQNIFQCPCHTSAFDVNGVRQFGPVARDMDTLETRVVDEGGTKKIQVHYQEFYTVLEEKKPKS